MNRVRNNNSYLDLIDDKGKKLEILTFFSYFIVEQNIKSIGNAKKLEELYQKYTKTNIR